MEKIAGADSSHTRSDLTSDDPEGTTALPQVLVVEDEPCVRRSLVRALRYVAETTEAGSVAEATNLVREREPFDGVVCDVNLGDGLGWDVVACVRETSTDTKIAMISGDARNMPHAEKLGVPLMRKPFVVSDIVRSLGLALAPSRSTIPPVVSEEDAETKAS